MESNSADRTYSNEHVWILPQEEGEFILGISEFAQQQLGDIVFVELPSLGDSTVSDESCAVVESVKSASDIICPMNATVVAVNEKLVDEPELINESPLERGWILRIKATEDAIKQGQMTTQEYDEFLASHG